MNPDVPRGKIMEQYGWNLRGAHIHHAQDSHLKKLPVRRRELGIGCDRFASLNKFALGDNRVRK